MTVLTRRVLSVSLPRSESSARFAQHIRYVSLFLQSSYRTVFPHKYESQRKGGARCSYRKVGFKVFWLAWRRWQQDSLEIPVFEEGMVFGCSVSSQAAPKDDEAACLAARTSERRTASVLKAQWVQYQLWGRQRSISGIFRQPRIAQKSQYVHLLLAELTVALVYSGYFAFYFRDAL